ncbi:tetratricopeptide repeat protein [Actinacidiphila sp. ITFR-21]|uniref:tetratricopeptide repeat protein n=1 Tax=Actinacidiphila sp. ITFR-21 TaxID=3075199 RepID=UPI002889F928|nr:tetratricopeptide repeat protein [Streptomyces sp. ITFR-21]WNI14917.1 tetratricopeptide repeat protein [Streptomyces sp. ITFR-21]
MTDQALDPPPAPAGDAPAGPPAARPAPSGPAPAPAAHPLLPGSLPPGAPRFVGRDRELAELRAEITRPGLGADRHQHGERARVLLVVGRPGVGRTAVALHLARQLAPRYPDGRIFLRLTDDDGNPVPAARTVQALLRALAARGARPGPDGAVRAGGAAEPDAAALRKAFAGRRILLVLDDVVHAGQLDGVLPEAAGSLVVATSGGPLAGVPDVRPSTLGGLDEASAVALLGHAVGGTRITNDPRGAESLAQEAAGHPTALRLVGAWLAARPRLSLSEAAARLRSASDRVFPAARAVDGLAPPDLVAKDTAEGPARLAGGRPAFGQRPAQGRTGGPLPAAGRAPDAVSPQAVARVRAGAPAPGAAGPAAAARGAAKGRAVFPSAADTVDAADLRSAATPRELVRAFRLVYEALPDTAARILRLLAVAPAGLVDAQSASALAGCSVPAAQSTLDDFVTGGLLTGVPEEGRYRLPGCLEPLLWGLVESRDRPEDVRLARARMLERTVRLLASCRTALGGEEPADGLPRTLRFASPAVAAGWLASRLPGLMAAARLAVADGELDTLARRLLAGLVRALAAAPAALPASAERYELHHLVLGVAERRGLHREKAAALINLADLDAEAGRPWDAADKYRRALDAARAGGDTEAEGRVLEALGATYLAQQDLPRACDWFGRALALRQARGELPHQARLHARIGAVLTYLGRYGPALREWRAAVGVHRRLADLPAQARALAEVAHVQEYAGHPEDALRTCRDALYWARRAGERRLEAAVLLRLADALDRLGDPGGAELQRAAARRLLRPGEAPVL